MKPRLLWLLVIGLCIALPRPIFAASDYEDGVRELTKAIVADAGKLQKQNLAVVDFTDLQGNVTALGRFLAEELSASLVMVGGVQVVDRNQLNKIFQEHSLSMLGISDPDAIKKVGKVAGADALITGSITEMADSVRVTAKVMATDTARVIAAAKTTIPKTGTIAELLKQGVEIPVSQQDKREPSGVKTTPSTLAAAIENTDEAVKHGTAGHADTLVKFAQEGLHSARMVSKGKNNPHLAEAIKSLEDAVEHGKAGHADIATKYAKNAALHLAEVR